MITVMSRFYREVIPEDFADFNKLCRGDQFSVNLSNGETVVFDITSDASGKLFAVSNDCLANRHVMNDTSIQSRWDTSEMRRYLNEDILPLFPDWLQALIVPTKIVQVVRGVRYECEDKLFCLSFTQVFGKNHPYYDDSVRTMEPEDSQLDIFRCNKDRIKCLGYMGNPAWWWLRSAYTTTNFRYVRSDGTGSYDDANNSGGVALGFCIQS